MALAMSALALAEAQALTAARAAQKGTSPGVVAGLHSGAASMFEGAARGLKASVCRTYAVCVSVPHACVRCEHATACKDSAVYECMRAGECVHTNILVILS